MKTYLVTGGASGIGKAFALDALSHGHQVIIIDKSPKPSDFPEDVTYLVCDLAVKSNLDHAIQTLKDKAMRIDVIVHNAATSLGGIFSASYEDFGTVMAVNVQAPFYLTQQLLPQLNEQASVLFIASTRAFQAQRDGEAYSASKGALVSLTTALANSLAGKVRVNCLTPGWIETGNTKHSSSDEKQHPAHRVGTVEDVIRAIYFLTDSNQSFIQGANLVLDGGMSKRMIYHGDEGWHYDPNQ